MIQLNAVKTPPPQVAAAARAAAASMATLGVALGVCSVPGAPPSTRLGPDEIELGLGLHGGWAAGEGPRWGHSTPAP